MRDYNAWLADDKFVEMLVSTALVWPIEPSVNFSAQGVVLVEKQEDTCQIADNLAMQTLLVYRCLQVNCWVLARVMVGSRCCCMVGYCILTALTQP